MSLSIMVKFDKSRIEVDEAVVIDVNISPSDSIY